MARRKQLKGVAGNLVQWCLSRNFDYEGYWAVGCLYAYAQKNGINKFSIALVDNYAPNEAVAVDFGKPIQLLLGILKKDVESLKIPNCWVKNVTIVFKFNTEYEDKYHYKGLALGGQPSMCIVKITTDQEKTYSRKHGCNVWVHNSKRESRRYGF